MALTDTALKGLRPKAKPYIVTDERGLYVEVFPTGGVIWRFRYRLKGKTEKLTLGKYPALTLKNARGLRDEAARAAAIGQSPATQKQLAKRGVSPQMTVAEFWLQYVREAVAKERRDTVMPQRYFDKDIKPAIGTKLMAAVTTEDVRAIIWRKKDHGHDAAAGQLRGVIKRMFDYGITCGVAASNPTQGLPMRHVFRARARERALSMDEIGIFIVATFGSNIRRQFKLGLYLLLLTMVRKGELMRARWAELDFDAAEWHIPAEHSKTGKPHNVYLSRQALAVFRELQALASDSEWVLPGRSSLKRPFALTAMNVALGVALKGTDVPAFTIHDLRRTASTLLHEGGWPSDVVEKALNHTIGGVRGVYNRAEYAEQRRKMLQEWADVIDAQIAKSGTLMLGRLVQSA